MELGEKLLRARQEAGLSQRQLCGQEITRNMLSQIEHGTARPSMSTLRYLAARLGKPVSYFLEEEAMVSPNQAAMDAARSAYDAGNYAAGLEALKDCRSPDAVYDRERKLLEILLRLALAEEAIAAHREAYARELLEQAAALDSAYCAQELEHRRLLLLGRLRGQNLREICAGLPALDAELLLRGAAALEDGDAEKAARLLEAADDRETPQWCLLRGETFLRQGEYAQAARCFHNAEAVCPRETAPRLEQCYRELGDYKQAYYYACKQRPAEPLR